jgi:hypothetical protein
MHAGKPRLRQDLEIRRLMRLFPYCGGEGGAVVVEREGLEGVFDYLGDFGVDEGVLH